MTRTYCHGLQEEEEISRRERGVRRGELKLSREYYSYSFFLRGLCDLCERLRKTSRLDFGLGAILFIFGERVLEEGTSD